MAFPDDSDRKAMLDMLVRGRELDDQYNKTIKQWQERDRLGQRREWFLRILFFLPLSIALGCFPAQGIFEGRIKNFFVDVSWFSSQEYPYAYWNSDPYVFSFLVFFYTLIAFALMCPVLGVTHFGRRRKPRTRIEVDRQLKEFEKQVAARKDKMVEVGSPFGVKTYSPRVPPVLVAFVISVLFVCIIAGVINAGR
ncbi:hypothetical protein [Candidatus Propionivibrio aalborgensis]|nr:hypothetical protein [Candidatus Propionivibrio aalborgensis]